VKASSDEQDEFPARERKMKTFIRLAPLTLVLVAGCAGADSHAVSEPDAVLVDVTIIDGSGAPPKPHETIEITDGRITAIRPSEAEDSATLDVAGSFVTPGLIDAHVHLSEEMGELRAELDSMLTMGITSVREMMAFRPDFADSAASVDSTSYPRVYWSAFWNGPSLMSDPRMRDRYAMFGDTSWLLAVTDSIDLDAEARAARDRGVTGIKTVSDLSPSQVRAVAHAAHAAGLKYWSHAVVFPTKPSAVVASGVDVISHAAFFVWEVPKDMPLTYNGGHPWTIFGPPAPYSTVKYDDPAVVAVLDSMLARGVILDPTLTIMTLLNDEARTWAVNLTRLAHEMGIPVVTGTDTFLLYDEIEALVNDVGFSPLEAISSATSVGAAAIGVEKDFGSIEGGKVADLVVYTADPSEDITALRHPSRVIKGGLVARPRT
jgi:imidazolonepropionase-like amidohydrolase